MRFRSNLVLTLALTLAACHEAPRPASTPAPPSPFSTIDELRRDIDATLAAPDLARAYWGILVRSLRTGDTVYALNAGRLLMPGSAIKIATLAAAAERLGWSYAYETRVIGSGVINAGVLDGDLLVVGSGDPSIVDAAHLFDAWADSLKAAGVREITGRIVGDDNVFDDERFGPGWTWEDLADRDGAAIGGLQYNENVALATIGPGLDLGAPAQITVTPRGHGLMVVSRVITSSAGSNAVVQVRRPSGSNRLELEGTVPLGGTPVLRTVAVDNPTLFFVTALREALIARGVDVRGPAVDIDDITDAPQRTRGVPLITYTSPPLSTLAVRMMKNSQNLYAETLLKTMGSLVNAPTWEASLKEERATLEEWGVPPAGLVQVDGSGLSRYNYASPESLVAILAHVDSDERLRDPFEAALPIAGRDGTLAARMRGTPAENNARAKTGTLANTRSLAGYVTDADGNPLAFAIVANNYGNVSPDLVTAAIDHIVVRLALLRRRSS
jgi:D-alanyl-D-alanine carboxypeptidase/D-alanyl-D-alanine-endopeptidase (penicillin-binding protein 4)